MERAEVLKKLGERMREVRTGQGKTQAEVAYELGIEQGYISGIERGEFSPSVTRLAELAKLYKMSIGEFLDACV